jgi:hypothetical protein
VTGGKMVLAVALVMSQSKSKASHTCSSGPGSRESFHESLQAIGNVVAVSFGAGLYYMCIDSLTRMKGRRGMAVSDQASRGRHCAVLCSLHPTGSPHFRLRFSTLVGEV